MWSRRFDGQDRAMTADEAIDELGISSTAAAPIRDSSRAVAGGSRRARRHPQHPSRARARRPASSSTRRCSRRLAPGSFVINTARGECRRSRRAASRRSASAGFASASTCSRRAGHGHAGEFADSDRPGTGCLRHASHRRVHRSGAGSDRRRDRADRAHVPGHGQQRPTLLTCKAEDHHS